ncbi:MAG: phosphate ABC transporter permease PstA, partial [Pseudomonadota bacterium]
VPVSDFADLYLKGLTAKPTVSNPQTAIKVSDKAGSVTIDAGADVFSSFLVEVKETVGQQAETTRKRLEALQRGLSNQQNILAADPAGDTAEAAKSQIESVEGQIAIVKQQFDALIARQSNAQSSEKLDEFMPSLLLRVAGGTIKVTEVDAKSAKGDVIIPLEQTNAAAGDWQMQVISQSEENRKFSDREVAIVDHLQERGLIESRWNSIFFSKGASREPELAGIWGAVVGSFFTLVVTLILSFPLGVAAAIYLEEFAPKNRLTAIIEVNINNLAAVPSIVFGLLGLAVFLNFFGFPRSAPLVGGMVLALMTLPTIIIASRAALKAVPPSIREAALGVGASKLQAVFHHVLPLAMPGMLTGTIIGMAQALGETAPLLMIGMVAFVVDIPGGLTDPATVLPVQIYMWADFPEPGFQQKTAAAIMVLLAFLVVMNAVAVLLRKRFERRW